MLSTPKLRSRFLRALFREALLFLGLALLFHGGRVSATTVTAPNFDELVTESDVVFDGVVTAITASWAGTGSERHIESAVTFRVLDTLKGPAIASYVLNTAGGVIGNARMEIADGPTFALGERMILFVEKNGTQLIPLVGLMHGQYRIALDTLTRREVLLRHNGRALFALEEIGRNAYRQSAASPPLLPPAPLTPDNFKAEIRTKLQAVSGK